MRRGDDGFTLMEALVALAVAAIASAGLMSALSSGGRRSAEAATRAEALSQARIILADAVAAPNVLELSRHGTSEASGLTWTVELGPPDQPYAGLQQVDVEVSWKAAGKKGVTRLAAYRLSSQ